MRGALSVPEAPGERLSRGGPGGDGDGGGDAPPLHADEAVEARFVHPRARALFNKAPCLRSVPLFGQATEGYGPGAVLSMALSYLLCKGVSDYVLRGITLALFKDYYKVDAATYQRLDNVVSMGWSLKAVTAVLSDFVAFFKYTKRWYMLASCLIGPALSVAIGILPPKPSSALPAGGMGFVCSFTKANVDILLEGHYSRMIRRLPGPGPALVGWIWWFIMIGQLIAALLTGTLADAGIPNVCAYIAAALQLISCVIFIFNWYGERPNREERLEDARLLHELRLKVEAEKKAQEEQGGHQLAGENSDSAEQVTAPDSETAKPDEGREPCSPRQETEPLVFKEPTVCCCGVFELNWEVVQRNKRLVGFSCLMACGVITMTVLSMLGTSYDLLYGCVVVSVTLCIVNFFSLPLIIAKASLYNYLQRATSIRFPGALSRFFIAKPDCVADGPHFTYFFYNTIASILATFPALIGITMFNYVFAKRSYWMAFVSTTILGTVAAIFDLIIVMRWNRPHVSDHAVFILGDVIVAEVISMMHWMPMIVLLSKLCPRGTESMVYAILAGFSNLGQSMGSTVGSIIMELKWPVRTEPPCDFSNLYKMIILAGLVPLVQIPLCFLLIPSARMCDDIPLEEHQVRQSMKKNKKKSSSESKE